MRNELSYLFVSVTLFCTLLIGCNTGPSKRVSLWRGDEIPYGTWYAYTQLPYLFTNAEISTWNKSPVKLHEGNASSSAYIIIGHTFKPGEEELKALLSYAIAGNHVFISVMEPGQNVLDSFRLSSAPSQFLQWKPDSLDLAIFDPATFDFLPFVYPGRSLDNYFTGLDSTVTRIVGTDHMGRANFVKMNFDGGGAFFVHLAPLAFSNFFLLHKNNKSYYDLALSAIPDSVNTVMWDDYFRHHINGENSGNKSAFDKLAAILSHEAFRWAFWMAVLLFMLLYFFETKRKQRVIPIVKPTANSSVDFVVTVGRLYYQQKNNNNLGSKMATHFLSHIRSRFNLPTSDLGEGFQQQLSYKSGCSLSLAGQLVSYIELVSGRKAMSDDQLLMFQEKIDEFYKNTR